MSWLEPFIEGMDVDVLLFRTSALQNFSEQYRISVHVLKGVKIGYSLTECVTAIDLCAAFNSKKRFMLFSRVVLPQPRIS